MLKITTQAGAKLTKLVLEGRLTGPWVKELDHCWREVASSQRKQILVDLTGMTFIAPEGKALLTQMWQQGAKFHAAGCLNRCIVEEIMKTDRAWKKNMKTDCAGESRSSRKSKRKGS